MDLTRDARNIFILGDLVIDHAIFAAEKSTLYQAETGEKVIEVIRRTDNAGGAANCARILACVSQGRTYLWGILGQSRWGSFRSILQGCHLRDGALANVELRGTQDPTDAPTHTITRLLILDRESERRPPQRFARFDDCHHLHVSDEHRQTALYFLRRAHERVGLDAIILNDLDMGALTTDLVREIAAFARGQSIPLFVDPKRQRAKYGELEGDVILPNLKEWLQLVGLPEDSEADWRRRIDNGRGLEEMARHSLHAFPGFAYHIIKCDREGAVLIVPSDRAAHQYDVYRVVPHPLPAGTDAQPQLGSGDVLAAIFALEATGSGWPPPTDRLLKAFQRANAVVSHYRSMPWHTMPTRRSIESESEKPPEINKVTTISEAIRFVPTDATLDVDRYRIGVGPLVSVYDHYKVLLRNTLKLISESGEHFVISGGGGSGKSTLVKEAAKSCAKFVDISAEFRLNNRSVSAAAARIEKRIRRIASSGGSSTRLFVDEALKGDPLRILQEYGLDILSCADEHNACFVFADADLEKILERKEISQSQFLSRCADPVRIPSLAERPRDIVYLVAQKLLDHAAASGREPSIIVSGAGLLAVVEDCVRHPDTRRIERLTKTLFDESSVKQGSTYLDDDVIQRETTPGGLPDSRGLVDKYRMVGRGGLRSSPETSMKG